MIKSSIEKLSDVIGFEIGTSDDVIQSNLLNGFCKGISNSIMNESNLTLQLCYIADKLNKKSEDVILELAECIKAKRSE